MDWACLRSLIDNVVAGREGISDHGEKDCAVDYFGFFACKWAVFIDFLKKFASFEYYLGFCFGIAIHTDVDP